METVLSEEFDDQLCCHVYDHSNNYFFPMILNRQAIAVCPHYGLQGEAVEKSVMSYMPPALGSDFTGTVQSLFKDTDHMKLKSFEDLKLHIFIFGLVAEAKRVCMKDWHWDQWLLNYHIALQTDGNVGVPGPRPGTTQSDTEIKKIQSKLQKRKKQVQGNNIKKALEEAGVKWVDQEAREKKAKEEQQADERQRKKKEEKIKRMKKQEEELKAKLANEGKLENAPIIEDQEQENESDEEEIEDPAEQNLTIDQMIGDYDDQEFMDGLHKKGQVFLKQEYHKVMPFCLAGDAVTLEMLLRFLEDNKRLGISGGEKEFKQALRSTTLNLLLYWARQSHHLIVTKQQGKPELIERLLRLLLEMVRDSTPEMELEKREKKLAWLIIMNGWDVFITSTDRTFQILGFCLENDDFSEPGNSLAWEKYYLNMLGVGDAPFSNLSLLLTKWKTWPDSFFPLIPINLFGIDFCSIKQPNRGSAEYEYSIEADTEKDRFMSEMVLQRGFYNIEYPEETSEFSLKFYTTPSAKVFKRSSSSITENNQSYHESVHAELIKQREVHNNRAEQLWKVLTTNLIQFPDNQGLWILTTHLLNRAFSLSTWTSIFNLELVNDLVKLIKDLHQGIPFEKKAHFYTFLSISLSMLIGIAHLSKIEVLGFFLNILNPLIDIASSVLQDINALVLEHYHMIITRRVTSQERVNGESEVDLIKNWALFLHQGIDFSQERVFETIHPYPLGDSNQRELFEFPGALGINVQMDPRSRVESSQDCISLDSSANHDNVNFQIDNNFQTTMNLGPRSLSSLNSPIFTIGPRVNVDFYGRNPVNQVRSNPQEVRWGYKLFLRPLYGERILLNNRLQTKTTNEQNRLEGILELSRSFSRLIALIRDSTSLLISGHGLDTLGKECSGDLLTESEVQKIKREEEEGLCLNQKHKDFLDWYLFKGGLIQNKSEQQCLSDLMSHLQRLRSEKIDQIEAKMRKLGEKRSSRRNEDQKRLSLKRKKKVTSKKEKESEQKQKQEVFIKEQEEREQQFKKRIQKRQLLFKFPSDEASKREKVEQSFYRILEHSDSLPHPNSKLRKFVDDILLHFDEQPGTSGKLGAILHILRSAHPYRQSMKVEQVLDTFTDDMKREWRKVENLALLSFMYHSSIDIDKLSQQCEDAQILSTENPLNHISEEFKEDLKVIAYSLDKLLDWMIQRVRGQKEFQVFARDVVQWRNQFVESYLVEQSEKREKERQEKQNKEKKEKEEQNKAALEEVKQKLQAEGKSQEEKKKQDAQEDEAKRQEMSEKRKSLVKKKPEIAVAKGAPRFQKKKSHRNFAKVKAGKKGGKNPDSISIASSRAEDASQISQVHSAISENPEEIDDTTELVQGDYFTVRDRPLLELKEQIHNSVYSRFLEFYQGDIQKAVSLCRVVDAEFDPENPNASLSLVFKFCKRSVLHEVDGGGGSSLLNKGPGRLRRTVPVQEMNAILGSPYEVVAKQIMRRALFLLLLKPTLELEQQIESGLSKDDFTSLALTRGESLNVARLSSQQDDSPRSRLSFVASQGQSTQRNPDKNSSYKSKFSSNSRAACKFLCSQCDLRGLKQDFQQQRRRAALRRAGLEFNQATIELCKNTPFARRSTGLLSQRLRKSALQGVESSGIDMLIKINEVALQTALTHMESVSSNFSPALIEKLSLHSNIKHQLYMATQPILLEILTHICEISLLFQDNFTKEFIFKLLNEAATNFQEIPLEEDLDLDSLILDKEASIGVSTDLESDFLVRFNSSQLLQEHAVRLRQASVRRCSNFSNMLRAVGKFTTQLLDIHFLIEKTQTNLPSKLVNLLKYASLGLLDTLLGDQSQQCSKLNQLIYKATVKHLQASLESSLNQVHNIQRIQDILLMLERFSEISPQALPLLESIILKSEAPILIQHALKIATPHLQNPQVFQKLIQKVGGCILPDIRGQVDCLRENIINQRKHHVYLHINAPNSDNYSFLLSALYHYEEECLKRDPEQYKKTSLLLRSELYKPVKTVQDLRKKFPDKVKRRMPKLPPDQPPQPKKDAAASKPPPRKRRTQELAQDYMHENPLQGLETLKGAFQEYTSLFMEPVYLHSDSEEEIKRKLDFYNWNERVMSHIRQAQRIAALLTSCGVANFCDVSLRGISQPYSYFGQNAGIYAGNVALNQRVEPPSPLSYEEAVLIGNLIKKAYLEKLPRIASNPYFRHWRAENNFNTERATLNFNQQNMEWLFPLESKLTVAQQEALQNALQEFDEREQLKPRKISLAEPTVMVSLVDADLHEKLTSHLQQYISKDINWVQNAPRADLRKLDKHFEGAEGFHYLMSEQACWPESISLSTLLQKDSSTRPVSSMLGQLNNPSTQFYSSSKLKDLDKKRFNGFTTELKQIPITSAQSNQQIIYGFVRSFKEKISKSEDAKSFFKGLLSETLKMIAKGSWNNCSLNQKQVALGILEVVGGWYRTIFEGMNVTINGKEYTVVSQNEAKVKVIGKDGIIEEFDEEVLKREQPNDLMQLVDHGQLAESILVCSEQGIEGADSILSMLLLKIAGKLNWTGAEKDHAAKLTSLLISLSQNKSRLSSSNAELKLRTSWRRAIDKLSLQAHNVTQCLNEVESSLTEEFKEDSEAKTGSQAKEEEESEMKQPTELILGYALPESQYIRDMPRTMQNVTNEVGLRLLHYWEKTLIPRTVQYCSSFPIQVLTNSIAQVRVPLRMGDITNATESILILLDRKVPNGCIIPSFNHDWNALIAQELKVGSFALAKIIKPSTDFIDTAHPFLHKCLQKASSSSSTISVPVLLLKFDQKLQAALCAISDHQTAQMYYVWIGCGSLYPMPQNQLPHITGVPSNVIMNDLASSIKELTGVYAQQTLLSLFYASGIFDSSKLSLLNLIEKSVQIELADRTINGWLDGIEETLPLRAKAVLESELKEDKDLSSFHNMNLLIQRVQEQDMEIQKQKNTKTYLSKFKQHLVSNCSLEELETLGDWCLEQWEDIKSAQSRKTLNLRELHEQQARTPEHNRYSTQKLIQLHSEDEVGAGVILVFQKDAYLSSNSKLSFYSDAQRVNLIYSVQAGRTDKQLEPIVFDSGKVWCEYSPGSFALLTEVEQRNPRKSQLGCSVVVVPQSWPTCCWLTENLTSALVYKCITDKSAALCGLKLTKKLIGTLCGFYEKGFSPAQIVQLLFRLMTRLIHKVRYFKTLAGEEETEDPQQAVESMGLHPKWLIQVTKNINTLIKKNRSSLTPPLIQEGVELLVTALVSPFQTSQIKYSKLEEAKLYPWLRASLDVASFLHNLSGQQKPEPMPAHIEEEVLTSLFLDSSDIFKNVFYFAQTEGKEEELKQEEEKKEEGEKKEGQQAKKADQPVKGPLVTIRLTQEQISQAVKNAVKNGHAKMLNPHTDIRIESKESSEEGILFINGWDIFYDEDDEGPDVIENDSDAEEGEGQKEEEAPPAEVEEEGWSCPQCTFINPMEELVCIICGQGMRPAVQPHQEVIEEDPNAEEDLTLTNDVIDMEKKQKSRTKRRRKYFLEVLEQALKGKVEELKKADLEKWKQAEDKRIKEVRDQLVELEKKRKEKEEQLREEQKKQKQEQDQSQKKKGEEPKEEKPIEVPQSQEEKELEKQLKRKPNPVYKEPQFIIRTFADAKDKNFKFINKALKKRLEIFVKQEGDLSFKKISQEICDEMKDIDPQNEKALPKLPTAPLAQGLGFTEWKQLKEMAPEILSNSMEELVELDVSALFEFLVSMGYDFHFNKMHALTTPKGIPRFGSRKLQLLRYLVEDKMCRETKSVFGLRGCDFFLASKSRGYDQETDPEPIGTFKDRLTTKMFSSLEKEDLLTLRYNWGLLKNFNAKLESAISLIKIRSNSIISENKFNEYENVPLALNVYINASRGICFSNIKRDLIQDAIYKTEVTVERRAKLEFERLKLAESLLKPADGEQDPLSAIQNKTQQVKLLPPNEIKRDVRMLTAILQDEEEKKEGVVGGVKTATLKLSRQMSDWASSNLSSKKIPRSMSPSHKDAASRLQKLKEVEKFELDNESEDGSSKALEGVRDPFAELDQIVLQSQITHNETLGSQLLAQQGAESESQKQASKSDSTMFAQAFNQVKKLDLSLLRAAKVKGTFAVSFDVKFRGEHVAGEGGPYRQFFADISAELQPSSSSQNVGAVQDSSGGEKKTASLSLLIPTPNNKSKQQDSKDKFIVNPREMNLELFEFLGIMMGCCIRTGVHLTLNLPTLFWKMLTGERILITDLEEVDDGFARQIKAVISSDSQEYLDAIFQNYSVKSVDWVSDIRLLNKPHDQVLKFEDKVKFIEEAVRQRFAEIADQTNAIKRGIAKMVPVVLLNLTTCHELEILICGKTSVDIDLLQRHTIYSGNLKHDSPRVNYFWETLREMSEEDQLRFIKFCWGQERLPANDEEFFRARVRFMVKPALDGSHGDNALPKADTCFFNLQLPNYSSKEILKQKLLLAIYFDCDSMNAENAAVQDLNEPEAFEEEE